MNRVILLILAVILIGGGVLAATSMFVVDEREQAIVLRFGEPRRVIAEPGLHFKLPLIFENVEYYEDRVLNFDPKAERVILAQQRPLMVDAFVRYKITDPLRFKQRVQTEATARQRLAPVVSASLRGVLGNQELSDVLSERRGELMLQIRGIVNERVAEFGIDVLDVRIGRADLPTEISESVYGRMRSERERIAADHRARGKEAAARIRAEADKQGVVIRAVAQRQAQMLRGEGEAGRTDILNRAFSQDPDFFSFYRSMSAYRLALTRDGSYMLLSPDSEFFANFKQDIGTVPLPDPVPFDPSISFDPNASDTASGPSIEEAVEEAVEAVEGVSESVDVPTEVPPAPEAGATDGAADGTTSQ